MEEINNINSEEKVDNLNTNKSRKFIEETKDAARKALVTMGIVAGSMGPINTSSVVPVSANTITHVTPTTPTTIKTIGQGTSTQLLTAFDQKDNKTTDSNTDNYTTPTTETDQINIQNSDTSEKNNLATETPEYKSIEINNISPADILPILGQIERGDKKAYEHIEHLRIAEATRIRDMMREYGAGNHSAEEYKQLMNRLHTGMTLENPKGYDNYETIGGEVAEDPSVHAYTERNILNTLVDHSHFVVANPYGDRLKSLTDTVNNNPNNIYIIGNSAGAEGDKELYQNRDIEDFKKLYKLNNYLEFIAGTNIRYKNGILKNKIYQEDVDGDESGVYAMPSTANGKNDSEVDRHLIVTIGTGPKGLINQTNETCESSKFPVGFHNDVLFAGRIFPYVYRYDNTVGADTGKYATSLTNYVNVAMADLCFQMFAEVKDVGELLGMIRSSTDLRDHIKFDLNGDGDTDDIQDGQQENQELILMNLAGFFQKYLMPTNLPASLGTGNIVPLEKGYYHGVVYQIPGSEVNINGEWIPFTDNNKDLIMAQNPMNLEWRLNGESLENYGYKPGDTITGQILVVDDQWNGLNMTKDFSVGLEESNHKLEGDVNGDGVVDVADIATIISVMAGNGNESSTTRADVNNDGTVDVADIATVISIMAACPANEKSRNLEDCTTDSNNTTVPNTSTTWYTISGQRLESKPTKPGIYILNGEKVIIE